MRHGSLFNGIGGFQLAASWLNWDNIFSVEIDNFCNKVTKKHFPNCKQYEDIKTFTGEEYRGSIDIISGGFPCQSFSVAGKQAGDLSLWKEMLRVVKEIQPSFVVAENVPGLITIRRGFLFNEVLTNLEDAGYEVQPVIIPAAGKNAPHKRERVWIVAYNPKSESAEHKISAGWNLLTGSNKNASHTNGNGQPVRPNNDGEDNSNAESQWTGRLRNTSKKERAQSSHELLGINDRNFTNTLQQRCEKYNSAEPAEAETITLQNWSEQWYEVAARFCRVDDGVPNRVDRLKALGNAIVPQIAFELFKVIDHLFPL